MDWESCYQEKNTPWDQGTAHPALVEWLRKHSMPGRVLVPGCGRGYDVTTIAASNEGPVIGLDLSPSALGEAISPPPSNVQWAEGDFFNLPDDLAEPAGFDWVWEHTCFCAIEPSDRSRYVEAALEALRPGGHLLGVFFLNPRDDPDPTIGPPFNATTDELDQRFEKGFELMEKWVPDHTYSGREGREEMRLYRKRND